MALPTGKIVARPMVKRACGCEQEFQHYQVDKYRAERLAKFQSTRCPVCVAKLAEEHRIASTPVPKSEALKSLPAGAAIALKLNDAACWEASLSAGGRDVKFVSQPGAGPQGVVVALARAWIDQGGTTAPEAAASKPSAPGKPGASAS